MTSLHTRLLLFRPECEISYVHVEERDVMRHRDEARVIDFYLA